MQDLFERIRDQQVESAIDHFRTEASEVRGAVFTRPEVVDFILDLSGYKAEACLWQKRLLEPSAGEGAFALRALERLLKSYASNHHRSDDPIRLLEDAFRIVEIHAASAKLLRQSMTNILVSHGFSREARHLVDGWVVEDDFLLCEFTSGFDFVVGNPPYVRQENIPDVLLSEYRQRFSTIFDRADLYVPFIERSLSLLNPGGRLGFICSDRWMKNRYGQPLRSMISKSFSLQYHVDMTGTDAFHGDVSAYPSITVIAREQLADTRLAHRPVISASGLKSLAGALEAGETVDLNVHVVRNAVKDGAPWILDQFEELDIVRNLEARFPLLEQVGCKVGIGVATGADKVFIGSFEGLPVEADRKQPLVLARDIRSGEVEWSGSGVVNPFADDGGLVDLECYPMLARYLESHEGIVRRRNVASRNPNGWYRTIDRIYPELTSTRKLLIPDIKGEPNIVLEHGLYYPHHNLYYITSARWPLEALQIVLNSTIARIFVEVYSIRMRGGYLRFQAQYLRRIRLPDWDSLKRELQIAIMDLNCTRCPLEQADAIASEIYEIDLGRLSSLKKIKGKAA
jgi:hypothetical protein